MVKIILDQKWDLSKVSLAANRIWVRLDGQVLPAAVSWQEMGRLAAELNLEQADLTCSVLEICGGKWEIIEKKTNAEIRAQIAAYIKDPAAPLPPPLFADLAEDGSFLFYHSDDGQPVRIRRSYIGTVPKLSFARVVFIAPAKIEVRYFFRRLVGFSLTDCQTVRIALKPPEKESAGEAQAETAVLAPLIESKLIQAWLFGKGAKLDPRVRIIERSISKQSGAIPFTKHQGLPYTLPGLRTLFAMGITRVKILLGEGAIGSPTMKTARLFRLEDDPDTTPYKCLAFFELDPNSNNGRLITLNV